jgi:hypothetical protein
MNVEAHIVEIERIVVTGADLGNPDGPGNGTRAHIAAQIAAELRAALDGVDLPGPAGLAGSTTRVAAEVARTVVRSIRRGADHV